MKAGIAAAAAASALLLGSAGLADAAVIADVDGTTTYVALLGEVNDVVISRDGADIVIDDRSGSFLLVSALGCQASLEHQVRCSAAKGLNLTLSDGDDKALVKGPVITRIDGGPGNDVLRGGAASDELDGGSGDDLLDGGAGADVLDGQDGRDTADYSSRTAGVTVSLDRAANDGESGEGDNVLSVERVVGGTGADVLSGSSGPDELQGGAGNDVVVGMGGNDLIDAGPGDDAIGGQGGVDVLIGGPGRDGVNALDPSPQKDKVDCGDGSDRVFADSSDGVASDCEAVDRRGVLGFTARVSPPAGDPELGRSVVLKPVSGIVLVTPPGPGESAQTMQPVPAQPAVPLDDERNVPVGTVVDTRRGRVQLSAAVDRQGTVNSGDFYTGAFQVFQGAAPRSPAVLKLRGGKSFGACPARERGRPKVAGIAKKRRRRSHSAVRSLWGSARGSFQTQGRFASATVRGTEWLTEDRCEGTLVRVKSGEVAVRDVRNRRVVLVHAGHEYLVRSARR